MRLGAPGPSPGAAGDGGRKSRTQILITCRIHVPTGLCWMRLSGAYIQSCLLVIMYTEILRTFNTYSAVLHSRPTDQILAHCPSRVSASRRIALAPPPHSWRARHSWTMEEGTTTTGGRNCAAPRLGGSICEPWKSCTRKKENQKLRPTSGKTHRRHAVRGQSRRVSRGARAAPGFSRFHRRRGTARANTTTLVAWDGERCAAC